jgi:uncharacterized protein
MNPEVEALRKVDQLDTKALKLKREIADVPLELEKHKARTKATADRLKQCHDEQKTLQREIDKLELEARGNVDQVKKYQVQQNTAKTNEEYATLKRQIDVLKKANADIEDKQLGYYERIDKLKAEEAAAKLAVKEAEQQLKGEEAEVQKEVAGLEKELGEILAQKKDAEAKISPSSLQTYRRILEKTGTRAIAPVHGRICQGCFIEIPPQALNTLLSGRELVQCKQCARILYLEHDYRAVSATSFQVSDRDRDGQPQPD